MNRDATSQLRKGYHPISDRELFLFASNGFWDYEERMTVYRDVKKRYVGENIPGNFEKEE